MKVQWKDFQYSYNKLYYNHCHAASYLFTGCLLHFIVFFGLLLF